MKAFVVLDEGVSFDAEGSLAQEVLKSRLEIFMVPRKRRDLVADLPKTATGKIKKTRARVGARKLSFMGLEFSRPPTKCSSHLRRPILGETALALLTDGSERVVGRVYRGSATWRVARWSRARRTACGPRI